MDPYYINRTLHRQPESQCRSFSPEAFQITVEYVRLARVERSDAVLKIQRVFRGFLVRKTVRKIKDVKKQVDAVDKKLSSRVFVELIRKVEKERLRMNESLMELLLKLDSVRCFGLGVRDCRKLVTRKLIALQEKIDSIVAVDCDCDEIKVSMVNGCCLDVNTEEEIDAVVSEKLCEERLVENDWTEVESVDKEVKKQGCDGSKKNDELMERIVEENKKMMGMMAQLVDSNEKQVKVLKQLANRIELLEKSFMCDE